MQAADGAGATSTAGAAPTSGALQLELQPRQLAPQPLRLPLRRRQLLLAGRQLCISLLQLPLRRRRLPLDLGQLRVARGQLIFEEASQLLPRRLLVALQRAGAVAKRLRRCQRLQGRLQLCILVAQLLAQRFCLLPGRHHVGAGRHIRRQPPNQRRVGRLPATRWHQRQRLPRGRVLLVWHGITLAGLLRGTLQGPGRGRALGAVAPRAAGGS